MELIHMCPHVFDVALCSITVKNAAHSLSLAGHPCTISLNPMGCSVIYPIFSKRVSK